MTPAATLDAVEATPPSVLSAERAPSAVELHLANMKRHRARQTVGVGLALGLLAEVLFDGVPLGLSVPLFTAAGLTGLRTLATDEAWQQAGKARLLALPMLFFAAMVAVRDSDLLVFANVAACLALAGLLAHLFNAEKKGPATGAALFFAPWAAALFSVAAAPVTVAQAVNSRELRDGVGQHALRAFRALFLTVPLLLLFGGLLMLGDARFSNLVSGALDQLDPTRIIGIGWYVVAGGLGLTGLFAHALRRPQGGVAQAVRASFSPLRLSDALVPLVSLCLLFGTFGLVRLSAVLSFDKYAAAAQAEFTYAREAHESFGALMAVVVLTLMVLLVFSRFTRLESPSQEKQFAAAGTLLVLLTGPVLFSGLSRLVLYQNMYGLTELRVYATWATLLAGGLLVWRAASLWTLKAYFGPGALAVGLIALATLNLYNPDLAIAEQNLNRNHEVVALDPIYLSRLSADAAPLVAPFLKAVGRPELLQAYSDEVSSPRGLWGWRWSRAEAAALLAN